jgi:hypothetical protein
MSSKFDFTSCFGIKKAFISLDKSQKDSFGFLENKNLFLLESLRNLVVHNAGIVDESFLKRWPEQKKRLRKKIAITTMEYSRLEKSAIISMTKLFEFGDKVRSSK